MWLEMVERCCPVCERADRSRLFAPANVRPEQLDSFAFASRKFPEYMHWRLLECRACDLLYASPVPTALSLSAAYREAAYDSAEAARFAAQTYARFLPHIIRKLPDLARALDIGTGDGAFLKELLAAGFIEAVGVEPSAAPIAAADPAIRGLIRHDVFRPGAVPPQSLSLVTCFQTFEHLSDPLAMCRDTWRALKPGGAIFFVGHNRRSLSAQVLGRKSPIFDVEHLQLFSPASVRFMVEKAGFERIEVCQVVNRYPLQYWVKLFPFPRRMKCTVLEIIGRFGIGRLPLAIPAGNLAVIGFRSRASPR